MKKLFLSATLLMIALASSAQISQGSWVTGGTIKFSASSSDASTTSSNEFRFSPQTYYTLNDHWGVGGGINFDMQTDKYTGTNETKNTTTTFGISPGVRYYGSISKTVTCYGQGNVCFNAGTTKYSYEYGGNTVENKSNITDFGARIIPGIMWSPKSNVILDFNYGSLSYDHVSTKADGADESFSDSDFNLSFNPWCICVGFYYAFGNTAVVE